MNRVSSIFWQIVQLVPRSSFALGAADDSARMQPHAEVVDGRTRIVWLGVFVLEMMVFMNWDMPRGLVAACFGIAFLFALSSCRTPRDANAEWDQFRDGFLARYFALHPAFAAVQGKHEYDGVLPDWSPEGLASTSAFLRESMQAATAFDVAGLDEVRQVERAHLLTVLDGELFVRETADDPHKNPFFYMHWASDNLDPALYVAREYAPLAERMRAYVKYLSAIPRVSAEIRGNLVPPLALPRIQIGRSSFGGLAGYIQDDVPGLFESVDDAALQEELKANTAKAVAALKELDTWLGEQEASATTDFALGKAQFEEMLRRTQGLDISAERLKQVAEEDLERNRKALVDACSALAPGKPVADCLAIVNNNKPDGGPVAGAKGQLVELRAFVQEHDLVSIPGPEQADVAEAPPHQRWNSAYIDIPGPFEVPSEKVKAVYYIAPPDPKWSKAEQAEYIPGEADLLFTSVHEVWPGHFLHYMHAKESSSMVGRVFQDYAFTEGWAHYSEEMMWDAGLRGEDPAAHVGQLLNALLRDARFVSAVGLHTAGMTVEESERVFRERAFVNPGGAKQQARRGTFDPGYLNYTLGKLMIRKLRDDWAASRGGRKAWKEFHDKILSFGGPPVPVLRKALLGEGGGPAL